jgi:hypothetical protein
VQPVLLDLLLQRDTRDAEGLGGVGDVVAVLAQHRLPDAGHSDFLASAGPLVDEVVVAFLDRYLKGDDEPLAAVPEAVAASGVATFEEKPGA